MRAAQTSRVMQHLIQLINMLINLMMSISPSTKNVCQVLFGTFFVKKKCCEIFVD